MATLDSSKEPKPKLRTMSGVYDWCSRTRINFRFVGETSSYFTGFMLEIRLSVLFTKMNLLVAIPIKKDPAFTNSSAKSLRNDKRYSSMDGESYFNIPAKSNPCVLYSYSSPVFLRCRWGGYGRVLTLCTIRLTCCVCHSHLTVSFFFNHYSSYVSIGIRL